MYGSPSRRDLVVHLGDTQGSGSGAPGGDDAAPSWLDEAPSGRMTEQVAPTQISTMSTAR
jgi:hypothetical protein